MGIECTGISAGFCPIHGDCLCPVVDGEHVCMDGETYGRDNPACPLHGDNSDHGEQVVASTLWGDFVLSKP